MIDEMRFNGGGSSKTDLEKHETGKRIDADWTGNPQWING
jgi:hypothetical protein